MAPSHKNASTSADWEAYAERPHFFGEWKYPAIFYRAVQNTRGLYIDVGAGDGYKLKQALDEKALSAFDRVIAYDISEQRVARLRAHLGVEAYVGDALSLPLADESVDFLMSDQVIEHVRDDRAMACEIGRVLAPNGRAFIGSALKKKGAWYFYRCNGEWRLDPTHLREYPSLAAYAKVFEDAGLEIVEISEEPLTYPLVDLFLRAMLRLRLLRADSAVDLKERNILLHRMMGLNLTVPRYFSCYATVRRRK